jgi:uncharacterized membrane protein
MLASWLHLAALAVYVGSLLSLWIIYLPTLSHIEDPQAQGRALARRLRLYNPLQTGALGVLVLSGALRLTDLKAAYRELFAKELGTILGIKLALAFVLIILGIHQTMGVGLRFVRRCDAGDPISSQDIASVTRRLKMTIPPLLILTVLTAYMGLKMRGF